LRKLKAWFLTSGIINHPALPNVTSILYILKFLICPEKCVIAIALSEAINPNVLRFLYAVFPILLGKRDEFRENLRAKGIEAAVHYPTPIHEQTAFSQSGLQNGSFHVSEEMSRTSVSRILDDSGFIITYLVVMRKRITQELEISFPRSCISLMSWKATGTWYWFHINLEMLFKEII
jgi:hypothetical protein